MKYLLVIAIVVIAYMIWRGNRLRDAERDASTPRPPPAPPAGAPQEMVRCPVCSVHLPRGDAVAGADGALYCSQEHRLSAGR
jgi:uncharacterized protein